MNKSMIYGLVIGAVAATAGVIIGGNMVSGGKDPDYAQLKKSRKR